MQTKPIKLHIGEAVLVAQAAPDVRGWGYCQFPNVERLGDGRLHVWYHFAEDSATAYGGGKRFAVSEDEGASYHSVAERPLLGGIVLANGDRIREKHLPSVPNEEMNYPEPVLTYISYGKAHPMYDGRDFPPALCGFPIERLAKGDDQWRTEIKHVNIPGLLRYTASGVFPHQMLWRMRLTPDGRLFGLAYPYMRGTDGKPHTEPVFIVSDDMGKTFTFLSKIAYCPLPQCDAIWEQHDSFTEPDIAFMPDGSILCVFRTENGIQTGHAPSCFCRSTNGGATWSDPQYYDHLGVWPTLLTLKCGVTLCCYGRPGLFIRATDDSSGVSWNERETILPISDVSKGLLDTCSYGDLLALGDDTALLVYSDFNYPDENGVPVKSILARRIAL